MFRFFKVKEYATAVWDPGAEALIDREKEVDWKGNDEFCTTKTESEPDKAGPKNGTLMGQVGI